MENDGELENGTVTAILIDIDNSKVNSKPWKSTSNLQIICIQHTNTKAQYNTSAYNRLKINKIMQVRSPSEDLV